MARTSLLEYNPRLSEEWHPTLNEDLKPSDVSRGSGRKVWWLGKCEHEWEASVEKRASRGTGCPYCAGQKVLAGYNDLATLYPIVALSWDYEKNYLLKPTEVTAQSTKRVWWKCEQGHSWEVQVRNRTTDGNNCPYCSNQKILKGYNDLATTHPHIAKYLDNDKNKKDVKYEISYGYRKKLWFIEKCGHKTHRLIRDFDINGCPVCSNQAIQIGINDVATTHPNILKEWHPTKNTITPQEVTYGSKKKIWWLGECGHEWESVLHTKVKGIGCPECKKELKVSLPEKAIYLYIKRNFKDTIENYKIPNYNLELDMYIPSLRVGIEYDGCRWHKEKKDKHKNLICKEEGIKIIRIREKPLPALKDNSIEYFINSYTDIKELEEVIYKILHEELKVKGIDRKSIDIERDKDKIYELKNIAQKKNPISKTHPDISKEWDYESNGYLTPEKVTKGSNNKVCWVCKRGHNWQAKVGTRTSGYGCPYCSNRLVKEGLNDLQTHYPEVAALWHPTLNGDLKPTQVTKMSAKKVWFLDSKGEPHYTSVYNKVRVYLEYYKDKGVK